jgi:hypothetical protein
MSVAATRKSYGLAAIFPWAAIDKVLSGDGIRSMHNLHLEPNGGMKGIFKRSVLHDNNYGAKLPDRFSVKTDRCMNGQISCTYCVGANVKRLMNADYSAGDNYQPVLKSIKKPASLMKRVPVFLRLNIYIILA